MTYKSNQIITMQGGTRKVLGVFTNAGGGESIYFLSKLKKYDEASRQPWTAKQIEREEIKEEKQPQKGDEYYMVDTDGLMELIKHCGSNADSRRVRIGNCYRTEAEALAAAERVKKAYRRE